MNVPVVDNGTLRMQNAEKAINNVDLAHRLESRLGLEVIHFHIFWHQPTECMTVGS